MTLAYDGDMDTFCHTLMEDVNFVQLNFDYRYVVKVVIFNRNMWTDTDYSWRLNTAVVTVSHDQEELKTCGTISTSGSEKTRFEFECGRRSSALRITLKTQPIHVAEVQIYGYPRK